MSSPFLTMIRKMGEFRRNEKLSRTEFESLKLAKFRRFVRFVNERSPYYTQLIEERKINVETCVPTDFPILTKSVLMANFDRIVTDRRISKQTIAAFLTRSTDPNELLFGDYHVVHTSGSSGEVGYFVYSEEDWVRGMSQGMRQRGSRPRPKKQRFGRWRMAFYGAIGGHFAGVSMMSSAKRGLGRLFIKVGLYEINTPLPQVIAELNAFQPDFIAGYTTGLKILAEKQRAGVLRIAPLGINAGGEGMTQSDKALLESAFGCEAISGYGCTEHLMMGISDPGGTTMTLCDDDLFYEFFSDHSLITNMFNYTLPLIRYRMSDILRPIEQSGAQENDSSPYIVINSLVGRTEKVPLFINRDGAEDFISPHTINEIFVAGVMRFQLQIKSKTSFRFAVCLDSLLSPQQRTESIATTEQRLRELLDQKLMNNVTFEVVSVDDLPVDPRTRKFKLIVDAEPALSVA